MRPASAAGAPSHAPAAVASPGITDWRTSRFKRWQASAIAGIGYRLIAALGSTLRWRVEGLHHLDGIFAAGRQPVMVFWHGRILGATYYFRHRGIVVITSENFDGQWIAGIIERFGYATARGSTSRGARRALLQLKRNMTSGRSVGFTLDGPRGPARVAQRGAIWLASVTRNPVLPFHLEAARHWTVRSWDRTQIPLPFSTIALVIGAPIDVPHDADAAAIDTYRLSVETVLGELETRALAMLR